MHNSTSSKQDTGIHIKVESEALTELQKWTPYRDIRHVLAGPQSSARWTRHAYRGFHQSFPFTYLNREARVWVKLMTHVLFPGQYFTDVTCDRVSLVYAFMTGMELNIRAVIKLAMRKARAHKGRRYAFGGLITKLCHNIGIPTEEYDYWPTLRLPPMLLSMFKDQKW